MIQQTHFTMSHVFWKGLQEPAEQIYSLQLPGIIWNFCEERNSIVDNISISLGGMNND